MNTAPRGGLDVEDQHLTVEQMRKIEKQGVAVGTERWYVAARHDATGQLVGFTELFWNPKNRPETAFQGGTAVRPEHRGHALGKWLKAANIQRLLDDHPEIKDIRTQNADTNEAMLGINEALCDLRTTIITAKGLFGEVSGMVADEDARRALGDALANSMARTEDAKGILRALKDLVRS